MEAELARVPLHPVSTLIFVVACWTVSAVTIVQQPRDAGIGVGILLIGVLVYGAWRRSSPPPGPRDGHLSANFDASSITQTLP